jgi:sulfhydrogenase subunit beta (sulfur reductase)
VADAVKLSREQLLAALRARGPIFASDQNGRWVTVQDMPDVGPVRPKRPLKDLFTPPRREIARWKAGSGPADIVPAEPDETPGSAFGVRPCDARALQLLDRVFLKEPSVDPHYKARRDNLLLVGVACEPAESCACGVFGFGPDDKDALDILLTPQDDGFLAQAGSPRGQAFLASVAGASPAKPPAPRPGPKPAWWTGLPDPKALYANFEHPMWGEMQTTCMNCGVCTQYCPTCQCFTIDDESFKGEIQRVRIVDNCQRSDFTRMAGGHDPRAVAVKRLRQRVLHKFAYIPTQNPGMVGCTGCGRCVDLCPLDRNLFADVYEIMKRINQEAERVA